MSYDQCVGFIFLLDIFGIGMVSILLEEVVKSFIGFLKDPTYFSILRISPELQAPSKF